MRIILIGPPGSGKGTQAAWLSQYYNIPHLSTGDMLRAKLQENSLLSEQIKKTLDAGHLVDDEIVGDLIQTRIAASDCQKGFILDGFPRTLKQAVILDVKLIPIQHVIEFKLADETIISRFSGRRIHPASGRIYHIQYAPPKILGRDDITGEPLMKRSDDNENTIKKRLMLYHENIQPVVQYYQTRSNQTNSHLPHYYSLNVNQPIQIIKESLLQYLKQYAL